MIGTEKLDPYTDLPEDAELAFLQLEGTFRAECDRRLASTAGDPNGERPDIIYVDYIAEVLGAITALPECAYLK